MLNAGKLRKLEISGEIEKCKDRPITDMFEVARFQMTQLRTYSNLVDQRRTGLGECNETCDFLLKFLSDAIFIRSKG